MINLENFDKFASELQSIVASAGIVVGGIWVLYTFWGQHIVQRANLDVAKTEKEIKKIEQESLEQPVLRTTIMPAAFNDDGYPASVTARFRNDGKLALSFRDTQLSLMQLADKKDQQAERMQPVRIGAKFMERDGTLSDMPARILRAGQERSLAFVLPELKEGSYFVELRTIYDGLKIVDGNFEPSNDVPIEAVEQTVLSVPSRINSKKSASLPLNSRERSPRAFD